MPECPEIRRAADAVEHALKNITVEDIYFAFPHLEDYEDLLKGAIVTRVNRKGKAMLIRSDNGYSIYSHNQFYGKWYIVPAIVIGSLTGKVRLASFVEMQSRRRWRLQEGCTIVRFVRNSKDNVKKVSFPSKEKTPFLYEIFH
ncbi:MAG: DNA-formamidopyrimidine glycosylase family protein [Bacillota bacterium]